MTKEFFVLLGRSGSGKGTQATLLKEALLKVGHDRVLHTTTGGGFREFLTEDNYTSHLTKEVMNGGGLNPEFLAIWNWTNIFINNIKGEDTVILDGAPRRMIEVDALHSALQFYDYSFPVIIHLEVREHWAKERLKERGREDDGGEEEIERKMRWYMDDVLPCVDYYAHHPLYRFIRINGEQAIDKVFDDLKRALASQQVTL